MSRAGLLAPPCRVCRIAHARAEDTDKMPPPVRPAERDGVCRVHGKRGRH